MIQATQKATYDESMALNIRNAETEALAAALAALTGETKTEAVRRALAERLDRTQRIRGRRRLLDDIGEIVAHCAALPVADDRSAEAILGYDSHGLPRG
jgi:antitoxin VapB